MKLPLQLLDPPAILPSFHGAGRPRLAETADRILLPGIQLRRIQTLLAAPGAPRCLIHCRCDDHRLQPCRRRPARAAGAGSIGQGIRPPTLQRRHADRHFTRHMSTAELSGGNSLATIRSLYACPYRAISDIRAPKVPILFRRQLV